MVDNSIWRTHHVARFLGEFAMKNDDNEEPSSSSELRPKRRPKRRSSPRGLVWHAYIAPEQAESTMEPVKEKVDSSANLSNQRSVPQSSGDSPSTHQSLSHHSPAQTQGWVINNNIKGGYGGGTVVMKNEPEDKKKCPVTITVHKQPSSSSDKSQNSKRTPHLEPQITPQRARPSVIVRNPVAYEGSSQWKPTYDSRIFQAPVSSGANKPQNLIKREKESTNREPKYDPRIFQPPASSGINITQNLIKEQKESSIRVPKYDPRMFQAPASGPNPNIPQNLIIRKEESSNQPKYDPKMFQDPAWSGIPNKPQNLIQRGRESSNEATKYPRIVQAASSGTNPMPQNLIKRQKESTNRKLKYPRMLEDPGSHKREPTSPFFPLPQQSSASDIQYRQIPALIPTRPHSGPMHAQKGSDVPKQLNPTREPLKSPEPGPTYLSPGNPILVPSRKIEKKRKEEPKLKQNHHETTDSNPKHASHSVPFMPENKRKSQGTENHENNSPSISYAIVQAPISETQNKTKNNNKTMPKGDKEPLIYHIRIVHSPTDEIESQEGKEQGRDMPDISQLLPANPRPVNPRRSTRENLTKKVPVGRGKEKKTSMPQPLPKLTPIILPRVSKKPKKDETPTPIIPPRASDTKKDETPKPIIPPRASDTKKDETPTLIIPPRASDTKKDQTPTLIIPPRASDTKKDETPTLIIAPRASDTKKDETPTLIIPPRASDTKKDETPTPIIPPRASDTKKDETPTLIIPPRASDTQKDDTPTLIIPPRASDTKKDETPKPIIPPRASDTKKDETPTPIIPPRASDTKKDETPTPIIPPRASDTKKDETPKPNIPPRASDTKKDETPRLMIPPRASDTQKDETPTPIIPPRASDTKKDETPARQGSHDLVRYLNSINEQFKPPRIARVEPKHKPKKESNNP